MQSVWLVDQPGQMPQVAREIIQRLGARKKIALYGEMGVGKTTFAKAFAAVLGVPAAAVSPTFSLINTYDYTEANGTPARMYHLDLYRIQSAQEALDIGIEDVLYDEHYCLIEWPQVIAAYLPAECVELTIDLLDNHTTRRIALNA